jgi:hypothetical protein
MPVTIGTMTSHVNMVDSNQTMDDALIERIITMAVARMKAEMETDEQFRKETEIPDRMSEPRPF